MSNKSRSRKQRAKDIQLIAKLADELLKVSICFNEVVCELKTMQKIMGQIQPIPKLSPGSTACTTSNDMIRHGKMNTLGYFGNINTPDYPPDEELTLPESGKALMVYLDGNLVAGTKTPYREK